jgi:hypothetical protein
MENLSHNDQQTNKPLLDEQAVNSFQSMIVFNDNLRKNIKLSLLIYKKLNNFEHNYIHKFFNDKSESNTK